MRCNYEGVWIAQIEQYDIPIDNGAPGAIPTRDLPLRRRTLYAAELREHKEK